VKTWIENDWATSVYPGDDRSDTRKQLATHLDALLDDPDLNSVWPGHVAPMDGGLISSARQIVQRVPIFSLRRVEHFVRDSLCARRRKRVLSPRRVDHRP